MKERKKTDIQIPGKYLTAVSRQPAKRKSRCVSLGRWITVLVLLSWDGLLLYMIVRCLIEPVYGGLFIAVVSIYMGYQLHEEE